MFPRSNRSRFADLQSGLVYPTNLQRTRRNVALSSVAFFYIGNIVLALSKSFTSILGATSKSRNLSVTIGIQVAMSFVWNEFTSFISCGAIGARASDINEEMKMAASQALAGLISDEELNAD